MMLRVKDEFGNIVPGLFKDGLGNIIVKNDSEYNKYIHAKQQHEIINNLTKEVEELKNIISSFIDKNSSKG